MVAFLERAVSQTTQKCVQTDCGCLQEPKIPKLTTPPNEVLLNGSGGLVQSWIAVLEHFKQERK